ncbi:MAG: hypothetical protein J5I94_10310, partial [Phaeodactylibacter sp.]|nr:hypothetical protein [Phaeodactylibacter sp.]
HLIAEEARCRADIQAQGFPQIGPDWLLGLTPFNQLLDDWSDTADWLWKGSGRIRNPGLQSQLLQIAGWLKQ